MLCVGGQWLELEVKKMLSLKVNKVKIAKFEVGFANYNNFTFISLKLKLLTTISLYL